MKITAVLVAVLAMSSTVAAQDLSDKPNPHATVKAGDLIAPYSGMPDVWPDDLVLTPSSEDGKAIWKVESVYSNCFFCEKPKTFREAAFDKHAILLHGMRIGIAVADTEITHHAPCFKAGTCREWNPLLGQTRAQAYSVAIGYGFGEWMLNAWLRKGNKAEHVGGIKYWWLIPTVGTVTSAAGIIHNLTMWNKH